MALSRYIKIFSFPDKPGHLLLYSTKKSSIALVKDESLKSMEQDRLSSEQRETLSGLGMVVPDTDTEKKDVINYIDRANEKSLFLNISVILNLDCNFRCVYCYEEGQKGSLYMTGETADLLVDFIKSRFTPGKKTINIDFYGGEPLLSKNLIKHISKKVKFFAESRDAEYTFTLVTNGSLLTKQLTEELVRLGLTGAKVTLDGPPETHNLSRPFKSGKGSFDSIIKNIGAVCDLIKIAVGGNYQKDNYKKFPILMDHLEEKGLSPEKIHSLKFDPAINSPKDGMAPADFTDGLMSINEPWVIKSGTMLREEVLKRGYGTPKITPSVCQVELHQAFVVNFDGAIYKCPSLIGKKGYEIGTLKEGVSDYSQSHNLGSWKNDVCLDCVYLPLCYGGCRYMSYVRDGNLDNVDCKKEYLDASLEAMIKQDIRYRKKSH